MPRFLVGVVAVFCTVLATATPVRADKRIVDLTPLFVKESAGCEASANGIAKVSVGATALVAASNGSEKADIEKDATRLAEGLVQLKAYCADVAAMVTFLRDNAKVSYRSVEKAIDTRDNAIRKQRTASKKLIAELSPITRKLIPLIVANKAATSSQPQVPVQKLAPAKFPSGRAVELPQLGGTWKTSGTRIVDTADYADKTTTASITARAKAGATCSQLKDHLAKDVSVDKLEYAEIPSSLKDIGVVWRVTYVKKQKSGDRGNDEMCAELKSGDVFRVGISMAPATSAIPEPMVALMSRMLVAQMGVTPPKS